MTQTMRERFDEKFGSYCSEMAIQMTQEEAEKGYPQLYTNVLNLIKDFIENEISSAVTKREEELVKMIEEISDFADSTDTYKRRIITTIKLQGKE